MKSSITAGLIAGIVAAIVGYIVGYTLVSMGNNMVYGASCDLGYCLCANFC
jgi:hypothetical protein